MNKWINFWDEKTKETKRKNCIKGQNVIKQYLQNNDIYDCKGNSFVFNLSTSLNMTKGSENSYYITIIPSSDNMVIRLRLSNHPSSPSEWVKHELNGVPDIRYSIWVGDFKGKDRKKFKKKPLKYVENNINVIEYAYNKRFLNTKNFRKDFFDTLLGIYNLAILPENKHTIQLTEHELYELIKESIISILE